MEEQQAQAMNASFNFSGVEEATGTNYTIPGIIAVFTITDAEYMKSDEKGTPGLKCTFQEETGSIFSHTFWLTTPSLSRVQSLAKYAANTVLNGSLSGAQLEAMFKGKKLPLKITPQIGKDGKVYANIPFGGFSAKNIGDLSFSAKEVQEIEDAKVIASRSNVANADSEDDGMADPGTASPGTHADATEF